jgi:hypothetical protein
MKSKSIFIFLLPLSLLLAGCYPFTKTAPTNSNTANSDVQELAFSVVKDEAYSAYAQASPRLVIIQTQSEWEQFWSSQVEGNKLPVPPAPQIDFQTQLLLAAFTGQKSTGGYGITVTGINTNTISGSADVVVYANQQVPAAGVVTTQALTSPAQVVSVERHNNFTLEDVYLVLRTPATGDEQVILAEHL